MKSIQPFCVVLSLVTFSDARPATSDRALRIPLERRLLNPWGSTSTPLVTSEQTLGANGAKRLVSYTHKKYQTTFAAYERNTGSRHPLDTLAKSSSTSHLRRATGGVVDLVNYQSVMYYGPFGIGTPRQQFTAIFDTGSSDILVPDKSCLLSCDKHERYDASKSTTSSSKLKPNALLYGSGQALEANEYKDVVQVAEYPIENQAFAAALFLSNQFWNNRMPLSGEFPADGLFGCGFEEISTLHETTPVENLNKSSQLPERILSFRLSDTDGQSEVVVGGANYTAFKNDTRVNAPVTRKGYWQIVLEGIHRYAQQPFKGAGYPAIVDTGTTLIVVPRSMANDYFSGVSDAECTPDGICSVPCDKINSTIPTLTIEGRDFTVCPSTWNFGPVQPGSSHCITGMGASDDFSFVIIGDVFMRNVYSIFDFGQLRVGFADLVDPVC